MIEGEAEATVDIGLQRVLPIAILGDRQACGACGEFGWRAMLVGAAQKKDLVPRLPAKAGMDVGGQERAREIAEMLDAVDVRQRAGDQELRHRTLHRVGGHEKALREEGLESPASAI